MVEERKLERDDRKEKYDWREWAAPIITAVMIAVFLLVGSVISPKRGAGEYTSSPAMSSIGGDHL